MTRAGIFDEINAERDRQERILNGRTCANPDVGDFERVAVLTEEVGEVARAILDCDLAQTRLELVQVAAVAVAWLELPSLQRAAT